MVLWNLPSKSKRYVPVTCFLHASPSFLLHHCSTTTFLFPFPQGLAQMLKGGVIMDVVNVEQARIAEAAGAVAVMALERIPADIRYDGGVARMSDPDMIRSIKAAVTIPVMAKVREHVCFYVMSI